MQLRDYPRTDLMLQATVLNELLTQDQSIVFYRNLISQTYKLYIGRQT